MAVPKKLLDSFEKYVEYPINLVFEPDTTNELRSCRDRIAQSTTQENRILVHFLDVHCPSNAEPIHLYERDITSDVDLRTWLGFEIHAPWLRTQSRPAIHDQITQLPSPPNQSASSQAQPSSSIQQLLSSHPSPQASAARPASPVPLVVKKDPECRFIFLHAPNSRSRLKVTHWMLARAFTHHQVMAGFVDFISVFGTQAESRGQRFCGFKVRSRLSEPDLTACDGLGRSGLYYQMCYNLRSAGGSLNNIWTIRQTVFHHQFDIKMGAALWISAQGISAQGNLEIKNIIDSHAKRVESKNFYDVRSCFASTLIVHKLHSKWCTQGWLGYIEYLEGELEKVENELAPLMSGETPGLPFDAPATREINLLDLQKVQFVERKSNEALMTLEANANILASIRDFYKHLVENTELPVDASDRPYWAAEERSFSRSLMNRESEIDRFENRCKRLVQLTADQKSLVIKQLEFQSSKKMERLSYETFILGTLAQKEAVAVRIITIVSLIYLPCSVVSSIFSTDIVKFQTGTIGVYKTSFSWLALQRWLEVTLPLTLLTLALGFSGYQFEKWRQDRDIMRDREDLTNAGNQ